MIEHMTFTQQVIMGLIHGGVPTAAIYIAAVVLDRRQHRRTEKLHVQLNGGLDDRIRRIIASNREG